jgi:hypothetical protein
VVPFQNVPGISYLQPIWTPQPLEIWNARHTFGRGPPKDHFSKVWLRLAQ